MSNPIYPPPSGPGGPGYPPPSGPGGPGYPPSPVNGTTILVLGILSFFCFGIILGPLAWIQGNNALKTLDQYGDPTNQRGTVSAGRICGIIGTILSAIGIVFYIIAFASGAFHHPAPVQ